MIKDYKPITKRLKAILSAFTVMLLFVATSAKAEVIATISQPRIRVNYIEKQTIDVTISLSQTAGETFLGFNGDLYLTNGVTFVQFNDESYIQKSTERCTSSHTVAATVRDDIDGNPLRFMLYSMNKNIKGTEGEVLTFRVSVPSNTESFEIFLKDAKAGSYSVFASVKSIDANKSIRIFGRTNDVFSGRSSKVILYTRFYGLSGAGEGFAAFSADVVLPTGLEPVLDEDEDPQIYTDNNHAAQLIKLSAENEYRLMVYSLQNKSFQNYSDFVSFDVKATDDLAEQSEIVIKNIKAVTGYAEALPIEDFRINVENLAANRLFPDSDLKINPNQEKVLWINLHNVSDSITSVQGDIVLPEGLEFVPIAEGEGFFGYADSRESLKNHAIVESNVNVTIDGLSVPGMRFMLYSGSNSLIKKNESTKKVIYFKVKASNALADTSAIKLTNMSFVLAKGLKYSFEDFDIQVVNLNISASADLAELLADLNDTFAGALDSIAKNCPDVVAQFTGDSSFIAESISALTKEIDGYINEGTANVNGATVSAKGLDILTSINSLIVAAETAQADFENKEATFAEYMVDIDALKSKVDSAKKVIDTFSIINTEEEGAAQIAALLADAYKLVDTLTVQAFALAQEDDSKINAIVAYQVALSLAQNQVDQLLPEAGKFEAAYQSNKTEYENLLLSVAELDSIFAAANATVAQDYALVIEAVAEYSAAIDAAIADLKAKVAEIAVGNAASHTAWINVKIEDIEEMIADYIEAAKAENDIAMGVIAPAVEKDAVYYSLSGKRLTTPVSGQINIVKYNDGSVRKIYIE